jgi:RNA polymerase-binding transcription factor DksA
MPKKQKPVKRQRKDSFLTRNFLKRQLDILEAELEKNRILAGAARKSLTAEREATADLLDLSATVQLIEDNISELQRHMVRVIQIRKAQKLIWTLLEGQADDEEYGKCIGFQGIECGMLIPQRRLEAVPWTLRCIRCEEKAEAGGKT